MLWKLFFLFFSLFRTIEIFHVEHWAHLLCSFSAAQGHYCLLNNCQLNRPKENVDDEQRMKRRRMIYEMHD